LINKLFDLNIEGREFKTKGTYGFWSGKRTIIEELRKRGFPLGAKSGIVCAPMTVIKSKSPAIRRAFLRGLFDTDGSLVFDKKLDNTDIFKKTHNFYPRIIFTTISPFLNRDVQILCSKDKLSFNWYVRPPDAYNSTKYLLQITGIENLERWMKIIRPMNYAKISRYYVWKKLGFCPTGTTLTERINLLKGVNYSVLGGS